MQILNCAKGPRILSDGTHTEPGAIVTIDDAKWTLLKQSIVVQHWLEIGDLKEITAPVPAAEAAPAAASVSASAKAPEPPGEAQPAAEAAAPKPARGGRKVSA